MSIQAKETKLMFNKQIMPLNSLYVAGMFFLSIVVLAFFWFIFSVVYQPIAATGAQMMSDLGTNSTQTDAVMLFFNEGVAPYILIFLLIIAGFWTFVYAQKKGVLVREG